MKWEPEDAMDLDDLKEDMIALRAEAEPLAGLVGHTLARIAELLLAAEKFVQELAKSGDKARADLSEVKTAVAAWQQQAVAAREAVVAEVEALESALHEQLPILEAGREGLTGALHETSEAAATLQKDLEHEAQKLQEADEDAASALALLGQAAQEGEKELRAGVEAAQLEGHQLETGVESATTEIKGDLEALGQMMDTLARQAVQTVADVNTDLEQHVEALTTAVGEAIETVDTGHAAFLQSLSTGIETRLADWRQAAQEAIDASDKLVHDVDEATQRITTSAGHIEHAFSSLGGLDGVLTKVIQEVKDVASTAGLDWVP